MHTFSNYDQWKLATPPEYERGDPPEWACRECAGTGSIWALSEPSGMRRVNVVCDRCDGTGEDPQYAMDEEAAE
jgi:hypothetical protein